MLLIDDIILAPLKGILWVAKNVHTATLEEIEAQHQHITAELSELYMMLDTGRITEEEFNEREGQLLDKLDDLDELK